MLQAIDSFSAKKAVGYAAAELIENNMLIGLGTGSTAAYFIEALAKRCQAGLKVVAVATSEKSAAQSKSLGIPLKEANQVTKLDITVDGADEIDTHKNIIKGGGGALLREKLLAKSSNEMIVIIDESKWVPYIGKHPLPVEIASFAYLSTLQRLKDNGYQAILRLKEEGQPYLTDNGNYIADIHYPSFIHHPLIEEENLKKITGVLETGLFYQVAGRVLVGCHDGSIQIY